MMTQEEAGRVADKVNQDHGDLRTAKVIRHYAHWAILTSFNDLWCDLSHVPEEYR